MTKVVEFFGVRTDDSTTNWAALSSAQQCPFLQKRCHKTRKGDSTLAIGTCTLSFGNPVKPLVICPSRLIDNKQVFRNCLHLLTGHEPGNDLHVIPEVSIPGGKVDFLLVSVRDGNIVDFLGIELQSLDTVGTAWPHRQLFLRSVGIHIELDASQEQKRFGMNWKMTAKTILVQLHHKIHTFEHLHKKLVLVVQDHFLAYMERKFQFAHLSNPARPDESFQLHMYSLDVSGSRTELSLSGSRSTDADGVGRCVSMLAEARVEMEVVVAAINRRLSNETLFGVEG